MRCIIKSFESGRMTLYKLMNETPIELSNYTFYSL